MLTPPRPKLPPLNAFRAFESAARLGGFSAAATELNVTSGAIAQQIKTLEQWAAAPLFERMSRGVRLTELGQSVVVELGDAFDSLGRATVKLRANHQSEHIRIAVLPSIAQLWLSPRLPLLRKIDPTKTISITALDRPPNLLREPYDLSLFFYDQYQLKWVTEICRDRIFPVCSPELAGQLKSPQDLAGSVFLHDTQWQDDWHYWMGKVIPDQQIDVSGPGFSLYGLAVQEAINGGGVLIGHESLVRNELDTGSLVAPFKERLELSQYLGVEVPSIRRKGSLTEKILDALQSI